MNILYLFNENVRRVQTIRKHNDAFRTTLTGGRVLVSLGVLSTGMLNQALDRVKAFKDFERSDRYHSHGYFTVHGIDFCFHVTCYCAGVYDGDDVYDSLDILAPELTDRSVTLLLDGE